MMVVQARAKAEAAKARAAFAVKEKKLKIETARLQATLEAMQEEKEMNAAIAEAEILEAGLLESECESHKSAPPPVSLDQRLQCTADYVHDQAHVKSIQQPPRTDDKSITFYPLPVVRQTACESDASQLNQLYQAPGGVPPQQLAAPRQQRHGVQNAGHVSQLRSSQPGPFQSQQLYEDGHREQRRHQPVTYQPYYDSPVPTNQGTQSTTLDLIKCMAHLQLVSTAAGAAHPQVTSPRIAKQTYSAWNAKAFGTFQNSTQAWLLQGQGQTLLPQRMAGSPTNLTMTRVTSKCTEVCGDGVSERACSKNRNACTPS